MKQILSLREEYQNSRIGTSLKRQIAVEKIIKRKVEALGIDENHLWVIYEPCNDLASIGMKSLNK